MASPYYTLNAHTAADYAAAAVALMPRGRAWVAGDAASNQAAVNGALAQIWAEFDAAATHVLSLSSPGANPDLLVEWEETLGLSTSTDGLNNEQRGAQVLSRFVGGGGQSEAYFIAFASALGFTIEITVYAPFRAGVATAVGAVYDDDWCYSWGVTVVANTSGFDPSVLIGLLQPMAPAETAVFLL
ncbi:putative phage tail protein [Novosphingobium sp. FSW06-99]|uniref:putative phage tail protein n=1 Tax=Novosphingobium sp. FSW06-99 TaxID=1739113 RepID=UPI00076D18DE|nr:putative phage tail protein [Novosphingobium sp. FSW06-99]KUR80750.1 hypothetical protein AQZ49_01605 [Novosphingobium sp. FSW06-99]